MRKILTVIISIFLILTAAVMPVCAYSREYSYTYNCYNEPVTVSNPYYVKKSLGGELELDAPRDVKLYNGEIYILDSGNGRIVVLDGNYGLLRTFTLINPDDTPYEARELTGIFITDDTVYAVDRLNECIVKSDLSGKISKIFYCPEKIKEQGDTSFIPTACVVDGAGYIYILLENEYRGFMVLDAEGNFSTYYGSAKVTVTGQVLKNTIWRNFMTEEQISKTSQYVPGGYADIEINEDGFIYAVRGLSDSSSEMICKLNATGSNVLIYQGSFGDYGLSDNNTTEFISVAVDSDGFISALDKTGKKIFRYTPSGELMYIFGGDGDAAGLFKNPRQLCCAGKDILVIDSDTNRLTVFSPEELTQIIDSAQLLYNSARFDESKELWNRVLNESANYEPALVGLGKVYEAEKDYITAMDYYRRGGSKTNYSSAFKKQRSLLVKQYFTPVFIALVVAVVIVAIARKKLKQAGKIHKKDYEHGTRLQYIRYAVFHPFDGYSELRYNRKENPVYALIITAVWFIATCLNYNYDGYIFNSENPEQFNLWIILASTAGVALLFVLSEWLLGTFFEGKGSFSRILCGVCYSLIPMIFGCIAELVLSNVLSADEVFFAGAVKVLCTVWSLALIFIAMKQINQYSWLKNLTTVLCAVLGVLVVVFLVVLFFNLWVQFTGFLSVIFREIASRIEEM